jgi:FixJ family two-component response regulator
MSRMLRRILVSAGFDVACYGSAEEFLSSEQSGDSACLILDMNLPGMSGLELQHELVQRGIDTPTVFISADADETAQRRVLDAGAVSFFSKPFSIDILLNKVRSVATLVLV